MEKSRYIRKYGKTRYLIKQQKKQEGVPKGVMFLSIPLLKFRMSQKERERKEESVSGR